MGGPTRAKSSLFDSRVKFLQDEQTEAPTGGGPAEEEQVADPDLDEDTEEVADHVPDDLTIEQYDVRPRNPAANHQDLILQEQNWMKEMFKNFREREESKGLKRQVASPTFSQQTSKISVSGMDVPFSQIVHAFVKNVQTLCQLGQMGDEEDASSLSLKKQASTMSRWPKYINIGGGHRTNYIDPKAEKRVEMLAEEFKVIYGGIQHILHVSNLE